MNTYKNRFRTAAALALFLVGSTANAALIELFADGSNITSLAQARALINNTAAVATGHATIIEFDDLGDGTRGNFSINNPFPGNLTAQFALRATGSFTLAAATTLTLELNHDDGVAMSVNGVQVLSADGVVDNRNTRATIALGAGTHSLEITFFERLGGATLELASIDANNNRTLFALANPVPEPATIALLGLGMIGFGVARRRRQS